MTWRSPSCGSGCPAGAPSIGARGRDRERSVVALVAVVGAVGAEGDRHAALVGADERVGDAVLRLRVAEVQVDVVPGGLRAHEGGGVGGQRRRADVGVPRAVGRQDRAAADDRPAGDHEGRARRARAPAAGPQPVAALGDAAAQADVGARVARGGDAAPVDRERLRQPAGDMDDQRAVRAHADGRDANRGRRAGRRRASSTTAAAATGRAGRTPRQASARLGRARPGAARAERVDARRRSAAAGRSSARSARPAGRGRSPRGRSARRRAATARRGA